VNYESKNIDLEARRFAADGAEPGFEAFVSLPAVTV
jgi:hypothetical protein